MPYFHHLQRGRTLFIHIPKAGGSSISQWIRDAGYTLNKISMQDGARFQHAVADIYKEWGHFDYKFMVVRDPLQRFASMLRYRGICGDADVHAKAILDKAENDLVDRMDLTWQGHIPHQSAFYSEGVEVFKFEENFGEQLQKALQIDLPFPKINVSKGGADVSHLSPKTIERVKEFYSSDYEMFGYSR